MKTKNATLRLCIVAVMSALFVVLDIYSIPIGQNIKITFSGLPIIIAAIYLGPVAGMTTGLIGGFVAQLINYGLSVTTLLWILPAGIRGLSMGLIFIAFKRSFKIQHLSVAVVASSLLVTIANTLVMWLDSVILNYYSFAYVFGATAYRFASSVLTAVAMVIIILPVTIAINKQNFSFLKNSRNLK